MGDEVVVSGGSSKKKWIWIGVVSVVVLLLVVGGWMFFRQKYFESQVMKAKEYDRDGVYMMARCIEYCPDKEVYIEDKNWSAEGNPIIGGYQTIINPECTSTCIDHNTQPFVDKMKAIENSLGEKYNKEMRKIEDFEYYELWEGSEGCFTDVLRGGDKSCIFAVSGRVERLESLFIEPIYENITINFTSLSCSPGGISMEVDFIEGDIWYMGVYLYAEGNMAGLERNITLEKGMNHIEIIPEEYPDNWEGERIIPDQVGIYYRTEPSESRPRGGSSDSFKRFCK